MDKNMYTHFFVLLLALIGSVLFFSKILFNFSPFGYSGSIGFGSLIIAVYIYNYSTC